MLRRQPVRKRCETKTPFLVHLYAKIIFLPRQARDKHGEMLRNRAFFAGVPSNCDAKCPLVPPLPPCPRAAPLAKRLKVVLAGV